MANSLRAHLENSLEKFHAFPTALTDTQAVRSLIDSLRPMETDKELIRLGADGDGGYLVPNDFDGVAACFSPGVGSISAFEVDCANLGMPVHLADGSVRKPPTAHLGFGFTKKFVGAISNDAVMTLDQWVGSTAGLADGDLLLQMDVEGSEYEVLLSVSQALLERFRILVVEFHMLDQLWNRPFFRLASRVFERICQSHACVHIHPNNCCGTIEKTGLSIPRVMEFTFLRRDRFKSLRPRDNFPDPLDRDNTSNPPLILPKCWFETTQDQNGENP